MSTSAAYVPKKASCCCLGLANCQKPGVRDNRPGYDYTPCDRTWVECALIQRHYECFMSGLSQYTVTLNLINGAAKCEDQRFLQALLSTKYIQPHHIPYQTVCRALCQPANLDLLVSFGVNFREFPNRNVCLIINAAINLGSVPLLRKLFDLFGAETMRRCRGNAISILLIDANAYCGAGEPPKTREFYVDAVAAFMFIGYNPHGVCHHDREDCMIDSCISAIEDDDLRQTMAGLVYGGCSTKGARQSRESTHVDDQRLASCYEQHLSVNGHPTGARESKNSSASSKTTATHKNVGAADVLGVD